MKSRLVSVMACAMFTVAGCAAPSEPSEPQSGGDSETSEEALTSDPLVCASYVANDFATADTSKYYQGVWNDAASVTSSLAACGSYMFNNVYNKPSCATPGAVKAFALLIPKSKHTYFGPKTIDGSTLATHGVYCPK